MFLTTVYYGDKIGVRVLNTDVVLFEEQMSEKEWNYLLEVAGGELDE